MSQDPAAAEEGAQTPWPVLTLHERRVLGVLAEKAKTTPDAYPLTLNSLVTGCNQKSNRDPVLELAEAQAEEAIAALKKKGLVQQIIGSGRVDKFRHVIYDAWKVDKVQLAILTELLLRGPQTEGELRGRASRMEPIADLDALRPQLRQLAERGLVVYLGPEGRRGTQVTHGFHASEELDRLKSRSQTAEPAPAAAPPAAAETTQAARLQTLENEVAELRAEIRDLQAAFRSFGQASPG